MHTSFYTAESRGPFYSSEVVRRVAELASSAAAGGAFQPLSIRVELRYPASGPAAARGIIIDKTEVTAPDMYVTQAAWPLPADGIAGNADAPNQLSLFLLRTTNERNTVLRGTIDVLLACTVPDSEHLAFPRLVLEVTHDDANNRWRIVSASIDAGG